MSVLRVQTGVWQNADNLSAAAFAELRPKAERLMMEVGVRFTNELKKTLTGARTGRTYTVSRTGKPHTASAPGEPPAVMFGNLRNSVSYSRPRWVDMTLEIDVGVGLGAKPGGGEQDPATTYARRLELGGTDKRGITILPRPYMLPTAMRMQPVIDRILGQL